MTDNQNTCQCCGKEYSRSETIRIFGDVWWTPLYCSAQCYTKRAQEKIANKKPEFLGGPETKGIKKAIHPLININTISEELLGYEMQLIDLLDKINGEIQELDRNKDSGSIEICRCLSDWKSEIGAFIEAVSTRRIDFENRAYEIRKVTQ